MADGTNRTLVEPLVIVEKTEPLHDGWVTTGTVAYPLSGPFVATSEIRFIYRDAAGPREAIKQTLPHLQALVEDLSFAIESHKDK
jgi:hypothetical protein